MEPEDSLLCLEEHTSLLFREPEDPLHMFTRRHFEVYFNIILSATILWFMIQTIWISRLFHASYIHLILTTFIILITFSENCKLWDS
jgi:hypothetical protein